MIMGWEFPDSIHWQEARKLMGSTRFYGPGEWKRDFGVTLTPEQMEQIAEFPWSREVLNYRFWEGGSPRYKNNFAFLGIPEIMGEPLTIAKLVKLSKAMTKAPTFDYVDKEFCSWLGIKYKWDDSEEKPPEYETFLTKTTCSFKWYFMSIEGSEVHNLSAKDQDSFISSTVERLTMMFLYHLRHGRIYKVSEMVCSDALGMNDTIIDGHNHPVVFTNEESVLRLTRTGSSHYSPEVRRSTCRIPGR